MNERDKFIQVYVIVQKKDTHTEKSAEEYAMTIVIIISYYYYQRRPT